MLSIPYCEFLLLEYAMEIEDANGRSTIWAALRNFLHENEAQISDAEIANLLLGMRGASLIELLKWEDPHGFLDFARFDKDRFFWGEFRIRPTYEGRKHHGRLASAIRSTPMEPMKPQIGFRPPQ